LETLFSLIPPDFVKPGKPSQGLFTAPGLSFREPSRNNFRPSRGRVLRATPAFAAQATLQAF
jgi:hypothetical protein